MLVKQAMGLSKGKKGKTMAEQVLEVPIDPAALVENLVTEDDTPVDNILSEKQQRLLTEPLYSSWTPSASAEHPTAPRPFIVAANVGIFSSVHEPPLVPDVFLSLDVRVAENLHEKRHRSYFFWEFGKAPEVVIEIVSNTKGNETGSKLRDYARIGILYYVIYDPTEQLSTQVLQVYELQVGRYQPRADQYFLHLGLGMTLWTGSYEGQTDTWLRWCDAQGQVIPTGAERAQQAAARAERLAAQLRALGVEPEAL
jgi:Uma2 family endonuclease